MNNQMNQLPFTLENIQNSESRSRERILNLKTKIKRMEKIRPDKRSNEDHAYLSFFCLA